LAVAATTLLATMARHARRAVGAALVAVVAAGAAHAAVADSLAARYAAWRPMVASEAGSPALAVTSSDDAGRMRGDIDGVVNARFDVLAAHLASPRDWCDIALLHLNVKTCTHERDASGDTLTFYSGSKQFETPGNAYPLRYAFRVGVVRADYVAVELTATTGPLDTRDYAIVVEAMPAGSQSFVHLGYAYRPSTTSRLATSAYLATSGSAKKGFSVVGQGRDGRPEYVGGVRGIVERNAVRNFFALQAFIDGDGAPSQPARRFERWFELTERYPDQLHELDRREYLAIKQREQREQLARQQAIDTGAYAR
jgi:hypothetical protein